MSPFHIKILLHIYAIPQDYEDRFCSKEGINKAMAELCDMKLIEFNPKASPPGEKAVIYSITEKGRVYVDALIQVPLPYMRWVIE